MSLGKDKSEYYPCECGDKKYSIRIVAAPLYRFYCSKCAYNEIREKLSKDEIKHGIKSILKHSGSFDEIFQSKDYDKMEELTEDLGIDIDIDRWFEPCETGLHDLYEDYCKYMWHRLKKSGLDPVKYARLYFYILDNESYEKNCKAISKQLKYDKN